MPTDDMPNPPVLHFIGGGESPVEYVTALGEEIYDLRFRFGELEVYRNEELIHSQIIGSDFDSVWSQSDTIKYLLFIGRAVIGQTNIPDLPQIGFMTDAIRQSWRTAGEGIRITMDGSDVWPRRQ